MEATAAHRMKWPIQYVGFSAGCYRNCLRACTRLARYRPGPAAAVGADLTTVGDRHVIDAFPGFAVLVQPALDDLHTIEVGAVGIAQRPGFLDHA